MEKVYKALDDVINSIKDSKEYKDCVSIKEKMNSNIELVSLIENVKLLQKKYIKSNYDLSVKKELDYNYKKLKEFPIYNIYLDNLDKVNAKIDYVRDSLNEYFDKLLN